MVFPVLRVKIPKVRVKLHRVKLHAASYKHPKLGMVGPEGLEPPTKRL
jgi:hypothetical protein